MSKSLIRFNELNYRKTFIKSVETDSQEVETKERKQTEKIPFDDIEVGQIFPGVVV